MSDFNFSNLGSTSFVNENTTQYLKAFNIYKDVQLTSIKKDTLHSSKKDTDYSVIAMEFKNDEGVYTHNLFVPNKPEDMVRRVNETSGAQYPSAFEQFQFTLMQLAEIINPDGAKKIVDNSSKIKTMDQFIDLLIKALSGKDTKFYLKLVGRTVNNVTYAALPNACILSKDATEDTKPIPLNFVSLDETKLSFSNYEMSQMNKMKAAKPTKEDELGIDEAPQEKDDSLDLANLEI